MSGTARVGLFGKLPSRGDFVRLGLPRSFTDPWDEWWQAGLLAAEARAGESWATVWQEAPTWRFWLPAGACGPEAVLGVVMPSVDRVGRCYPLTMAAMSPGGWDERFLQGAEAAGRNAMEEALAPEQVSTRLSQYGGAGVQPGECVFLTRDPVGSEAREIRGCALPAPAALAGMIGEEAVSAAFDDTEWMTT